MKFKQIILPVLLFIAPICALAAELPSLPERPRQGQQQHQGQRSGDFKKWRAELLQYKQDFMVKELKLDDGQRQRFLPLYQKMQNELWELDHQTRQMERQIEKSTDPVTDLQYEKATDAMVELQGKQNAIEQKYYREFKSILSPKQLYQWKRAERKFQQELMQQRAQQRNQQRTQQPKSKK